MSTSANTTVREDQGTARKFLFDRSFDDATPSSKIEHKQPAKPIHYTAEQLEAEKRTAYENGFNAGQSKAEENQQAQLNALMAKIDKQLSSLIASSGEFQQQEIKHAREVAVTIARKIMPSHLNRHGLEEIESVISQVLSERTREPRLVVRVGESCFDELSSRITQLSEQNAYAGKVIVLAEDGLGPSDCRVEWADGGIERDTAALWQTIENIMGVRDQGSGIGNNDPTISSPLPEPRPPIPGETT